MNPAIKEALDAFSTAAADLDAKQSAVTDAETALAASAVAYNGSIDNTISALNAARQS